MVDVELRLPCATDPNDSLTLRSYEGDKRLFVIAEHEGVEALIDLSEDQARQLFNWLGVRLHA